jgi:hypothetical protein
MIPIESLRLFAGFTKAAREASCGRSLSSASAPRCAARWLQRNQRGDTEFATTGSAASQAMAVATVKITDEGVQPAVLLPSGAMWVGMNTWWTVHLGQRGYRCYPCAQACDHRGVTNVRKAR